VHRTPLPMCLGGLALVLTTLAPKVRAQDICIPEAFGVPNLNGLPMNGAPIWWGTSATMMTRLDDPRWRGAVSQDFNGEVAFRALHRTGATDTLFLSWQAKIDRQLDQANVNINPPTGDQLVVGIKQLTGPAVIIHFGLASAAAGQEASQSGVGFVAYTWDGTTLSPAGAPQWITGAARTWTWVDVPNNKARWTFQMVVPISAGGITAGVNLNTTTKAFQMFYAFLVKMPVGFPEYRWPSGLPNVRSTTSTPIGIVEYPSPTLEWGKLSWGTSLNCAGDVALDPLQIGTGDPPDWHIKFDFPPASNSVVNQITAKPTNLSGSNITAGRIQADFFLSNYGSQIADPSFWRKISPAASPTSTAISPGSLGLIQFPWTVPDADRCKYIEDPTICQPPGISDQCILVQLSEVTPPGPSPPPPPPPLVFRNQSAYMNMLFSQASTLRHRAQISVVGLTPLADSRTTRDVYLYVETVNMPARISSDASSKSAVVATRDTLIVARRDTALRLEGGVVRLARGDSLRVPLKHTLLAPGASAAERFAAVRRAAETGKITVPEVDAAVPTYRIHAYHATSDSLGKDPILEPQTSFGYWVSHDGEIVGWKHRIKGERLVKLAPNYYKIEVPNNGTTTITTIIEALEPPRFALSLHAGVSLPHGNFGNAVDPGFGVTGDLEMRLNHTFTAEALFGFHRFKGVASSADVDLTHISGGLKAYVTPGRTRLFVSAGGGTYTFDPGATDPGAHAGAGIQFNPSLRFALEAVYTAHTVFTSGSNTTFSSIQAGGRIRF